MLDKLDLHLPADRGHHYSACESRCFIAGRNCTCRCDYVSHFFFDVDALRETGTDYFDRPIQTQALRKLYQLRRQSMVFTDKRIRLVSELLGGIRLLKTFSWEIPYAQKVHDFRTQELV